MVVNTTPPLSGTAVFFWVGAEDRAPGALMGDFDGLSTPTDVVDDGSIFGVDSATVGGTVENTAWLSPLCGDAVLVLFKVRFVAAGLAAAGFPVYKDNTETS